MVLLAMADSAKRPEKIVGKEAKLNVPYHFPLD
jgi:hypothetical protein